MTSTWKSSGGCFTSPTVPRPSTNQQRATGFARQGRLSGVQHLAPAWRAGRQRGGHRPGRHRRSAEDRSAQRRARRAAGRRCFTAQCCCHARRRFRASVGLHGTAYESPVQPVQESLGGIRDIIIDQSQSRTSRAVSKRPTRASCAPGPRRPSLPPRPASVSRARPWSSSRCWRLFVAGRRGRLVSRTAGAWRPGAGRAAAAAVDQHLCQRLDQRVGRRADHRASVAALLRLPVRRGSAMRTPPLPFRRQIQLRRRSAFTIRTGPRPALSDLSLTIPKGARVAIVGKTGSGKSTLADLLMGLIEPTEGKIRVDGVVLAGHGSRLVAAISIAHVPQSIFLADASIARNIAFGIARQSPDMDRVRRAAATAQLADFVRPCRTGTTRGRRARRPAVGRPAATACACPRHLQAGSAAGARRGDQRAGRRHRSGGPRSLDELHAEGCTIVIIAHRRSTIERLRPGLQAGRWRARSVGGVQLSGG